MKVSLLCTIVFCYNWKVHEFLGNLIINTLPVVYNKILPILNGTSIAQASIWADTIKKSKRWSFSRPLHYINIIDKCSITEKELTIITTENIYTTIIDLQTHKFKHQTTKEEQLKFMLHFIQDITQPLHVFGKLRGGNDVHVIRSKNNRNKTTDLHTLWDSELPSTYIASNKYVPTIKNTSIVDVINYNLKVGCRHAYNFTDNYIIFEDYYQEEIIKNMFDNYLSLALMYFKD